MVVKLKRISALVIVLFILFLSFRNCVTAFAAGTGNFTCGYFQYEASDGVYDMIYENSITYEAEVVVYPTSNNNGIYRFDFMSTAPFTVNQKRTQYKGGNLYSDISYTYNCNRLTANGVIYCSADDHYEQYAGTENITYSDFKYFDSWTSAYNYLKYGTLDGLLSETVKPFEYNPEIGFVEFRTELHYCSKAKGTFLRFYYTPTQFMLENNGSCTVNFEYNIDTEWVIGLFDFPLGYRDSFELDLSKGYFDFYPYKFLPGNQKYFFNGDEVGILDLDDISIGDIDGNLIAKISNSCFYFEFFPQVAGIYGNKFNAFWDCLDNTVESYLSAPVYDDETEKYTPDYEPVNDTYVKTKDYYYTDVNVDNHGNNTYNYYYINDKGISTPIDDMMQPIYPDNTIINGGFEHQVTGGLTHELGGMVQVVLPDSFNFNVNVNGELGSGGGSAGNDYGNVTIEDDDYSGSTFVDNVTNLYGLKDDLSTAAKDDGALVFLKDSLGTLPAGMTNTMGYGVGSIVFVAIMRAILRR